MSTPLISVIVPVFNCERFVAEALRSVLVQDYPNLEIVVVDDGSTDGTLDIVRSLQPKVRVVRQRNLGPAAARNRGIRESRGEYLAFLDGDDVWLPGKLAAQMERLQALPSCPIVFTQFAYWRADAQGRYRDPLELFEERKSWLASEPWSGWLYPKMLLRTPIHIIAALIPRAVYEAVGGFDEALRGGSDYDFWIKAGSRFQAQRVPGCFALYRLHAAGVTALPKPVNYGYVVLTRALAQIGRCGPDGERVDERQLQQRLADVCFRYGRLHYMRGDPKLAREAFLRAFRHNPRLPRAVVYALLSGVREAFGARVSDALYRSARALARGSSDA